MAVKFEWNDEGFGQILQSPGVANACMNSANQIAARAGDGFNAYEWTSHAIGKIKYDRAAAIVSADTAKARREEATDKKLQKAVTACSTGI